MLRPIDIGGIVQFMALIYVDEAAGEGLSAEQRAAVTARYFALADDARAAGVMRGGEGLEPTRDATTVRIRDGRTLVTDGPYAETRETLGGFFLFECESMDDALRWAARIPAAERTAVEVRPVRTDPVVS
jgi:hypothetical protein